MNSRLEPIIRDRSIDYERMLEIRATLDDKILYDSLIRNTRYVNHKEFCDMLKKVVNSIKTPLFNVFIDIEYNDEGHSEEWCLALSWPYITNRVSKVFQSISEITDDLPLLLIDDCIYTGIQVCSTLMHISNNAKIESQLQIILATAYGSSYINRLLHPTLAGKLNTAIKVEDLTRIQIKEFIVGEILEPVGEWINPATSLKYIEQLGSDNLLGSEITSIPIYFDHKIANKNGSFPQIYLNIMKYKPNRLGINLCHTLLNQYGQDKYSTYKEFLDNYLL
ncbi:MAG: hypothetical protein WD512_15120 [Candidatus Paceibacterota bacterium]